MCEIFVVMNLAVIFASIVIYSLLLGISPMPSSKKAKEAIIRLLPKNIEDGVIYELGSGWGGLAFRLAKKYPKAKIIAFELSPIPFLISRMRQLALRRANLIILWKNFYDWNLSDAGAIVCYLFPGAMRNLAPKFRRELPIHCMIISNTFALPDWKSDPPLFLDDLASTPIYVYQRSDQ